MYGVEISAIGSNLKNTLSRAVSYVDKDKSRMLLDFGVAEFQPSLVQALNPWKTLFSAYSDKSVWLVSGSATLLNVLYQIFPSSTRFNVVQVGRTIWKDLIEQDRTTVYVAPERFFQRAQIEAPYPSVPQYDSKLWRFVLEHGKPGDLIWNVGSVYPVVIE
jgi:hypothetical protein